MLKFLCPFFQTPNALVSYSLPSDALTYNRYFQITPTGNLTVIQPLPSETNIIALPVCVGFFLFFFIGGGECYCLYHCWYVNKIILVKMGRGTC